MLRIKYSRQGWKQTGEGPYYYPDSGLIPGRTGGGGEKWLDSEYI